MNWQLQDNPVLHWAGAGEEPQFGEGLVFLHHQTMIQGPRGSNVIGPKVDPAFLRQVTCDFLIMPILSHV